MCRTRFITNVLSSPVRRLFVCTAICWHVIASPAMRHYGTCPPPPLDVAHQFGNYLHTYFQWAVVDRLVVNTADFHVPATDLQSLNALDCKGNYSGTLNNMKLVHWSYSLMGVLLHLVQRGARPVPLLLYQM